jgi:hypothetical protein
MGPTIDRMHAFAAYGHLILRPDVEEAERQLLAAAHTEGRLVQADTEAYLNSDSDSETPSPWDILGVYVVEFGVTRSNCYILASHYTRTPGTDPIGGLELPAVPAREPLAWGLKALGFDAGGEEPEWFLGWYRLTF